MHKHSFNPPHRKGHNLNFQDIYPKKIYTNVSLAQIERFQGIKRNIGLDLIGRRCRTCHFEFGQEGESLGPAVKTTSGRKTLLMEG